MQKVEFQKPNSEVMKSGDSPTTDFRDELSITRSKRHFPPNHYMLKIESYSLLVETGLEKYESLVFEVGGYKWRLSLYPKGNKEMNGSGHISLYIKMVETENLPLGWEVYVSFKLFVFDHIQDKYLTIEESADVNDRSIKRFHDMKTEWGFAKFLSLDTFNDVSHGYLVNDCCQFGVEVFVHERNDKQECVSMIKEPTTSIPQSWKIENFSTLDKESYYSAEFTVEGLQWKIKVYPKGISNVKGKAISVFLFSCNCQCSELKLFAEFKLRIRDPMNREDVERTGKRWFSNSAAEWGVGKFILLNDLYGASRRLLFNDTLIVEAEIKVMSTVKRFP